MKKIVSVITVVLFVLASFSACTGGEKSIKKSSLVLCIQNTANSAEPMLNDADVISTIHNTVRNNGEVTILEIDGKAYTVDTVTSNIKSSVSDAKRDATANQITKQIVSICGKAVPETAEIDVLQGLNMAARNLDASADEKTILYLGSALSTAGYLQFANQNLFETDIEDILQQLKEKCAVPSFPSGTKVIFGGLGDVIEPQQALSCKNVDMLRELMKAICEEGGAQVEYISSTPVTERNTADYPSVSTVTVYQDYVKGSAVDLSSAVSIDSTQISFKPDSYELKDRQSAADFLRPFAEAINKTSDRIYICGTTATVGTESASIAFSEKRAHTIYELLMELGASPDKITAIGLGYNNNFHIPDILNGRLDETSAQKNRRVLIIPSSCPDVNKL